MKPSVFLLRMSPSSYTLCVAGSTKISLNYLHCWNVVDFLYFIEGSARISFSLSVKTIAKLDETGKPLRASRIEGWNRRDQETFWDPKRLKTVQKPCNSEGVAIER